MTQKSSFAHDRLPFDVLLSGEGGLLRNEQREGESDTCVSDRKRYCNFCEVLEDFLPKSFRCSFLGRGRAPENRMKGDYLGKRSLQ